MMEGTNISTGSQHFARTLSLELSVLIDLMLVCEKESSLLLDQKSTKPFLQECSFNMLDPLPRH